MDLALKGAQQFVIGTWHLYEENVNLYRNLAQGFTAKAQDTVAIAVVAVGCLRPATQKRFYTWCYCKLHLIILPPRKVSNPEHNEV